MAKVNIKRDRESGTPSATPETTVHVMEPRTANSVKRDQPAPPQAGPQSVSAPEVIDADYVETSLESTDARQASASSLEASEAEVHSARPRTPREGSAEFSFVNYVLLFFSAALLSALVMLAVMGQL